MHCFITTNRDQLPDDIVSIFGKHSCTFGFATHLFSHELKFIQGEKDTLKTLGLFLQLRVASAIHPAYTCKLIGPK